MRGGLFLLLWGLSIVGAIYAVGRYAQKAVQRQREAESAAADQPTGKKKPRAL